MPQSEINIIADIGGTNMRVAQIDAQGNIANITIYACAEHDSLAVVLTDFITRQHLVGKKINACLAIACPVDKDLIVMTNLPWQFSQTQLKSQLQLNELVLINDFTAIAHAIPHLGADQKVQIGVGDVIANKPISICGAGTGLGVANLIPLGSIWHSLSGEGGHVDFAPVDKQEIAILQFLSKKYDRVSCEQLLSGLGIEQIYQALSYAKHGEATVLPAKEIAEKALSGGCPLCVETLAQFCRILGSFAGNLALTLGSYGGVYIAGGIVPRFIEFFASSEFRKRFEAKGRLSSFNQPIPTFVVTEEQPGLLGASAYLDQYMSEKSKANHINQTTNTTRY
ncbi:glucokinase [Cognaticolwellia beringensis]|uniref:Glucokinase n=1 Tax=Cognaticolwellia beringensis TaxID=1967665 RepID=A0A222GBS5_9GAMM|nr:glucokinase [Cognaticolwellia beringensis]ASP49326.1 glucokinase [Cognaticolwellia beringensis]|tara:strand:- start:7604 stop:8620 length:1017 start_codon:yes stop_codon:yes gene_type:complete